MRKENKEKLSSQSSILTQGVNCIQQNRSLQIKTFKNMIVES